MKIEPSDERRASDAPPGSGRFGTCAALVTGSGCVARLVMMVSSAGSGAGVSSSATMTWKPCASLEGRNGGECHQ
jgi:hypothetical protein